MNKIFLVFALILSIVESKSQNLVPNQDFEDTIACPNGAACIYCCSNWGSCHGSPDYFNICAPSCLPPQTCAGIPNNWAGTQNAFSGGAYAGIILSSFSGYNREIIIAELIDTLEIGKKYFFSCYIARAYENATHGASNNFGFRFSTVEFDAFNEVPIDNFSHYRDTAIITDTTSWTLIEGSFTADSLYRFLMLGNFYDDNNTDTIDMRPTTAPWNHAYYYIDQVCVTPDSGNCSQINSTDLNKGDKGFFVFPNPFNVGINIQSSFNEEREFSVYDLAGRKIDSKKILNNEFYNLENLEPGIYLYVVKDKSEIVKSGKLVKQ